MQTERFYFRIGIFVFGAILLALASMAFFYVQYIHGQVKSYVMFFSGSLQGVNATSPVTYRGVKVGEVKRIELTSTRSAKNVYIPVYVEFFVEQTFRDREDPIHILINRGVVATISPPNLLTGTSAIELIPSIERPQGFAIKTFHGVPKFPTLSTGENKVTTNDTLKAARKTLNDISELVRSKELKDTISTLNQMAKSIDHLSSTLNHQMPNALSRFVESMTSVKSTAGSLEALTVTLNKQMPSALTDFTHAITAMEKMIASINQLTSGLEQQLPGALTSFNQGFDEFSKAAYSARNLTDFLARHPDSLLRGRS